MRERIYVTVLALATTAALLAGCDDPSPAPSALWAAGEATDPAGDMLRPGADVVGARIEVLEAHGEAWVSVRWAPGTFAPDSSLVTVSLDVDQDPATGHPGINATGSVDADLIGSEYVLRLGAGEDGVLRFVGRGPDGLGVFEPVPTIDCCFSYVADGVDARFSLSHLHDEDGLMSFKVVSLMKVGDGAFSGWLDVVPDTGLPAASVEPVR